ncbi:hypothetical protein [Vibrio furnissii]|uniref:hypothetical protein n=1 Tax=Vibrio furnissii TaxID=29494 RepID=UPI00118027F6|nr:hypothetical protein [Vibrio furnissii]MBM4873764.1 hypothetical protein [Vibrio parahaemolyticus]HAS6982662.1 hypothetical protein [Vibrio parahaemolyticus]
MIPLPRNYIDFDPHFSCATSVVEVRGTMTPRRYLDFAIVDMEQDKSERGRVNAFSNAKRALHLQVETLANIFGFTQYSSKPKRPNFHSYLDYVEKCGVITPRILRKLNSVRNAVEHDYYVPTEPETDDFIDIVELFIAATERAIYQFPNDVEFLPTAVDNANLPMIRMLETMPYSGQLKLNTYDAREKNGLLTLTPDNEEYFVWLRLMLLGVHQGHYGLGN